MIRMEAVSRRQFNVAVFEAMDAITGLGGWIKNQQLYSNMMAAIAFELPGDAVGALVAALAAVGIMVEPLPAQTAPTAGDVAGYLSISFLSEGPDVHRPVPAVG